MPTAVVLAQEVDDLSNQRVDCDSIDLEFLAIAVRYFDQDHAGERDHGVEVVRHAHDTASEFRIMQEELQNSRRVRDGLRGGVPEVRRNWFQVVGGLEPSKDVREEM